jgi:two-component system NarL family sensor kinase
LTGIALHIESALTHLEDNPLRARERLQQALVTTQESLEEARRSVLQLRATPLLLKSLREALPAYVRAYTSETGIRVRLRVLGEIDLSFEREAELFRIVQEALTNVRRHAAATSVVLALRQDQERLRMVIHDDGVGCNTGAALGTGHGLIGIVERAQRVGGSCRLLSRHGRGMTVAIFLPLGNPMEEIPHRLGPNSVPEGDL